jgi:peptidoglycan DL-endopeptidase CwlO
MTCPSELELSRALSEGADAALDRHLAECAACRARWDDTRDAIAIAGRLSAPPPSADRIEEVRTELLARMRATAPARSPRRTVVLRGVGLAAAAAAGVIGVLALRSPADAPEARAHLHGTVRARPGAAFLASSGAPDEIVVLFDGTIDVDVAPLHRGERFRVFVGESRVEVHGTAFAVTAHAGRLTDVEVAHGVVEVQLVGAPPRTLRGGEAWRDPGPIAVQPDVVPPPAPEVVAPAPGPAPRRRAPAPAPAPTPDPAPAPPAAPAATTSPEEDAYNEAWTAMRANDFTRAASAFARVRLLDPDGPLAEDTGFWYAVAIARSDHPRPAIGAFESFLEQFPRGARAGEASAMLGWLLLEHVGAAAARPRFEAALTDPSHAVRESATAGLAAITARE